MPEYIYQCEARHTLSLDHSIFEDPQVTCDLCHSPMARKPQSTAIEFKSSGFYSKDSRDA